MTEATWTEAVVDKLVGKTIKSVEFMSTSKADEWMWSKRPLTIRLSDGHELIISMDDEGNDGGSIFTSYEDLPTIPALSVARIPAFIRQRQHDSASAVDKLRESQQRLG